MTGSFDSDRFSSRAKMARSWSCLVTMISDSLSYRQIYDVIESRRASWSWLSLSVPSSKCFHSSQILHVLPNLWDFSSSANHIVSWSPCCCSRYGRPPECRDSTWACQSAPCSSLGHSRAAFRSLDHRFWPTWPSVPFSLAPSSGSEFFSDNRSRMTLWCRSAAFPGRVCRLSTGWTRPQSGGAESCQHHWAWNHLWRWSCCRPVGIIKRLMYHTPSGSRFRLASKSRVSPHARKRRSISGSSWSSLWLTRLSRAGQWEALTPQHYVSYSWIGSQPWRSTCLCFARLRICQDWHSTDYSHFLPHRQWRGRRTHSGRCERFKYSVCRARFGWSLVGHRRWWARGSSLSSQVPGRRYMASLSWSLCILKRGKRRWRQAHH